MSVIVRVFGRRDRDQVTALVNLHVAAVIPGVVLSVNTVLGQLEREPDETVVDPWVAERRCLVAERGNEVVAAALLHRFRSDPDVGESYRGSGDIRWLICKPDAVEAGRQLLKRTLACMRAWRVRSVGAECALPALGCYGVPDSLPHLRGLLVEAGFAEPTRTEVVLAARCERLAGHVLDGASVTRTLGVLGARFTLTRPGVELGFIEVCEHPAEMARSSTAARWADVGNLAVHDDVDFAQTMPALLSAAARWLLLGGVTLVMDYWAEAIDPPHYLDQLRRAGFEVLVSNERGFARSIQP